MRILFFLITFFLVSCHDPNYKTARVFTQHIPDTSKTWAGQRTREAIVQCRQFQEKLRLDSIHQGTAGKEIRIWQLSSFYDPQLLQVVKKLPDGSATLRVISFMQKKDSVLQDLKRNLRAGLLDSSAVSDLWTLPSQSEMTDGDSYGCIDGSDLLIEVADAERYKVLWYRCPDINGQKNQTFQKAFKLTRYFANNISQ